MPQHDVVTLAHAGTTVEIVPALGGKIASLHMGGREWLWTSPTLPRVAPTEQLAADDAASYVEVADTGGFDECFPTVGTTRVPANVPGFGGLALPDHGELWAQAAPTERLDDAAAAASGAAAAAVTRWRGRRMPYALARTVAVEHDGAVRMTYVLTSSADVPLPFLWSSHPLLPLTPDTRLELPVAARVRVWAEHGIDLGGERTEHRWPVLRVRGPVGAARHDAGHAIAKGAGPSNDVVGERRPEGGPTSVDRDVTLPAAIGDGYACKLFLDLPRPSGGGLVRLAIEQGNGRLECEVDPNEVTHFGLWINHGGWTPFADGTPYRNLAFEPCIGAPDPLDAALGEWKGAAWLAPGEERRWTLRWRGRRRPEGR